MRKRALTASAVVATGLFGLGGTAFAGGDPNGAVQQYGDGTAQPNTTTQPQTQAPGNVRAVVPDRSGSVVGLNVPVAADLHNGVLNNLNAQNAAENAARNAVAVGGNTVPAAVDAVRNVPVNTGAVPVNTQPVNATAVNQGNGHAGANAQNPATGSAANANSTPNNAQANAVSNGYGPARAVAVNVGDTVNGVVQTATATVNGVTTPSVQYAYNS